MRSSYNCFRKESINSRFLQGGCQPLQEYRREVQTGFLLYSFLRICLVSGKAGLVPALWFHISTQLYLHWSASISLINWFSLHSPVGLRKFPQNCWGPGCPVSSNLLRSCRLLWAYKDVSKINQVSLSPSHASVSLGNIILGTHRGAGFLTSVKSGRDNTSHSGSHRNRAFLSSKPLMQIQFKSETFPKWCI